MHVYVATPTKDWTVSNAYVDSIVGLRIELERNGHRMTERRLNGGPILLARNLLAASALRDPDVTHLFFVDADVGFVPSEVCRMLSANVSVIGGVYPLRAHAWDKIASRLAMGLPPHVAAGIVPLRGLVGALPVHDAPFAVDSLPNGCLAIRRDVLVAMVDRRHEIDLRVSAYQGERIPTWFDRSYEPAQEVPSTTSVPEIGAVPAEEIALMVSEDTSFCRRWRALGGHVLADPRLHLVHVGPCSFDAPSIGELLVAARATRSRAG